MTLKLRVYQSKVKDLERYKLWHAHPEAVAALMMSCLYFFFYYSISQVFGALELCYIQIIYSDFFFVCIHGDHMMGSTKK